MKKLIFNVGYTGEGNYSRTIDQEAYQKWYSMLKRSYSKTCQKTQPTYRECTVDSKWHNFQNFAKWYYDNHKPYMVKWQIDKDILLKNNKFYSDNTCTFVPHEINSLFTKSMRLRGKLPIGVSNAGTKFEAKCRVKGVKKSLGRYFTIEEAFNAYKIAKEIEIKRIADKYKGRITEQTYFAMYKYEVEIYD